MNGHHDAVSVGVSSADVAWPIVLAMCIALMIMPFLFVILAKGGVEPDDPPD